MTAGLCPMCDEPVLPAVKNGKAVRIRKVYCSRKCSVDARNQRINDLRTTGYRLIVYMRRAAPGALNKILVAMEKDAVERYVAEGERNNVH
jgi:hypothetical protein